LSWCDYVYARHEGFYKEIIIKGNARPYFYGFVFMYMPGTKDFTKKLLSKGMPGLTSMVLCFEDACPEADVPAAEENTLKLLHTVSTALEHGEITYEDIPLIFIRVRSVDQFKEFSKRLTLHLSLIHI